MTTENDALLAELEKLKQENSALKKTASSDLSMKVSQKGALSVYGLGRFPVTLYKQQWERLLAKKEDIVNFIAANSDELKTK